MNTAQKIINLKKLHEKNWGKSYPKIIKVIRQNRVQRMVEIGVAFGGNSEAILKNTKIKKIYGVDRYMHDPSYKDPMNLTDKEFSQLKKMTIQRLSKFKERFELINKPSIQASSEFIYEKVDLVYIDGDHTFKGCLQDIIAWSNHIKKRGILSGHDYDSQAFPGVTRAANLYAQLTNQKVNYEGDGVWWLHQKQLKFSQKIKIKFLLLLSAT